MAVTKCTFCCMHFQWKLLNVIISVLDALKNGRNSSGRSLFGLRRQRCDTLSLSWIQRKPILDLWPCGNHLSICIQIQLILINDFFVKAPSPVTFFTFSFLISNLFTLKPHIFLHTSEIFNFSIFPGFESMRKYSVAAKTLCEYNVFSTEQANWYFQKLALCRKLHQRLIYRR